MEGVEGAGAGVCVCGVGVCRAAGGERHEEKERLVEERTRKKKGQPGKQRREKRSGQ